MFLWGMLSSVVVWSQQYDVNGYIKYSDSSAASDILITIVELDVQTVTESNGYFSFEKIPAGKYTLHISDYYSNPVQYTLEGKDEVVEVNYYLSTNPGEKLNEVVIEGKTTKTKIETQGFAVNVVSMEKVSLQSVQTNDLLDRTAGVRIRQDGGLGSHVHYNINGQSGNAVKIFIDGVPISNFGPSFSLNSIPPSLIDRIEVYKGVVPAYLSEDALGGAINVVLKKSLRNNFSASYSFGSFNTHQLNFFGRHRNEKNGFTFQGSGFYNYSDNSYKVWGKDIYVTDFLGNTENIVAKRFHDAYRSYGGIVEFGYTNVKWADRFMIGLLASSDYKEIQHGVIMRIVYGNRFTTQSSSNINLTYQKKDIIPGLDLNINGSYSYLNRQVIDTIADRYSWNGKVVLDRNGNPAQWASGAELGNKTALTNLENIIVLRANLDYKMNQNNKMYVNAFYNSFQRDINDKMLPVAQQQLQDIRNIYKTVIGFNYENLSLKNRLRTNLFYKYYAQNHESIEPKWAGNVGTSELITEVYDDRVDAHGLGYVLSYEIHPNIFLMTSAERAIRMPNSSELFGNEAENIIRSPDLKPEHSLNLNLGVNFSQLKFNKHTLGINTNFFYRHTNDMIRLNQVDDLSETNNYTNFESIVGYGFDAEINYNYSNKLFYIFTISKFYSTWNEEFDDKGQRYPWYKSQLANEPSFKFNSNFNYNFRDAFIKNSNLSLIYNASYVHEFLRNFKAFGGRNVATIPTQFVHDIGIVYTFPNKRYIVSFDAKNITNEQVFDNYALQKPGRAFYGKITINLVK